MFDNTQGMFEDLKNKLINEWNPGMLSNEKEYQDDLEKFLNSVSSEGRKIYRERGRYNSADLVIDDKIGIEMKKDVNKKSDIDRCTGQVKRMKQDYNYILLVLVGHNNKDTTINDMRNELNEFLGGDNPIEQGVTIDIVNKDPNSKVKKGEKKPSSDPLEGGDPFSSEDFDLGLS